MEITGIAKSHQAYNQKTGKLSSGKEWKLSNSLRERIAEYAREDAAQDFYMGNKFLALRKSEVAKVAPDRTALMGKIDMKEIREADERWLRLLFGEPYEAKFQSGAVHVYDGNGDVKSATEADVSGKLENLQRLMGQFTMPEDGEFSEEEMDNERAWWEYCKQEGLRWQVRLIYLYIYL